MPHRITSHRSPLPPPMPAPGGSQGGFELEAEVSQVLQAWAAACEHSDQTRTRMSETVTRFTQHAGARGLRRLREVGSADARAFITALTRDGREPELATQHARRTALRTLYRTARRLDLATGDPTLDVVLPPRGCRAARPLSDDEVTLCRASTRVTRGPGASLRAAAWALGEATAISSEITQIRVRDLDDPRHPRHVQLPGTWRHDPRTATLSSWGAIVLRERAGALLACHGPDALLAYGGHAPPGGAKAQASVCNAVLNVLDSAGLLAEADIRPASLRHWAGRSAYDTGTPLEDVARLLGLRSLDATAADIALDWRREAVGSVPASAPIPDPAACAGEAGPAPVDARPHRHLALATAQEDSK